MEQKPYEPFSYEVFKTRSRIAYLTELVGYLSRCFRKYVPIDIETDCDLKNNNNIGFFGKPRKKFQSIMLEILFSLFILSEDLLRINLTQAILRKIEFNNHKNSTELYKVSIFNIQKTI